MKSIIRRIHSDVQLMIGTYLFILLLLISICGYLFIPTSAIKNIDYGNSLIPPGLSTGLGTDELGRSLFSLIVYSIGLDVTAVLVVLVSSILLGILIGGTAGFIGGMYDEIVMRITDMFFAIPPFILAMAVVATLGRGIEYLVLALVIATWPAFARLVRGQVLQEKEKSYIEALYAVGMNRWRIFFKHMIPNIIYPVIIYAVTIAGVTIIYLAGLSYIGFGTGVFVPELGELISSGQKYTFSAPWLVLFPGFVLFMIVVAFNFIGEGLNRISRGDS